MALELFRNTGIRSRIIFTTLCLLLLPIGTIWYIKWAEIQVNLQVLLFLGNIYLLIGLVSSWIVASSITKPANRIRRKLEGFLEKKAAQPIQDFGEDELGEIAGAVNRTFALWNNELGGMMKKQRQKIDETEKIQAHGSDLEKQLSLTRSCLHIARSLNTTFDFHANLKAILDEAVKTLNVQWASILLVNRETLEMTVACVRGIEQSLLDDLSEDHYPSIKLKPNEGLAGQVIKGGMPLIANKGHRDPRFKQFSEFQNREEKIASILCAPVLGSDGAVLGVVNFINRISPPLFQNEDIPFSQDIAVLVALVVERNKLYKNLFSDDQTGLLSYRVWKGHFEEEALRAIRYAQPLSILIVDLDKFREILEGTSGEFAMKVSNDCAKILQKTLRETDLASRVQDRYYLLLPYTDASGSLFLAGRIKEALEAARFDFGGREVSFTASAGIAAFPGSGPDPKKLSEYALKALEQAKSGGRNRVVIQGAEPDPVAIPPES